MTRSYLVYEGPGDLRVEMGLCDVVPLKGAFVTIDGRRYKVGRVDWHVFTKGEDPDRVPPDYYPQQCATVHLRRA